MKAFLLLLFLPLLAVPHGSFGPLPGWLAVNVCHAGEATQYTCGMHPMIVVDEPGTCPICHMELTPLKGDGSGSSGTAGHRVIHVDPATIQKMGIRTALAELRALTRKIRTVGLVGYQEPGQHAISSKVSGWVEKLYVNESGQTVAKGDPLLEIYSPELLAAQEELLLAVQNRQQMERSGFTEASDDAERLLSAARRRLQLWDISKQQIAELEKRQRVQKSLTLYAPTGGVVSKKMVRDGEFIVAGRELLEISDISQLWLYADIYEYELAWVKLGQQVQVQFPFNSAPISGTISNIYPYLEARTRTVKARINLENIDFSLKPDMYADVTILTDPIGQTLSIPAEAILFTGTSATVFVALGEGRFEPRAVQVGLLDEDGYAEILGGVTAGERVVTSAQFMLDSESKLREALHKMLDPEEAEESLEDLF